jgi:hypothetical protein
MYKLINQSNFSIGLPVVKRIADNTYIPFDPANMDYVKYLEWLAEGNTPEQAEDS